MAIAGKAAIVPKGDWASNVEYEKLNAVRYNNKLFIAKQTSTNRVPVGDATDQYWMLSLEGITSVFTGATVQTAGTAGLVPAPSAGDQNKLIRGDGSWGYAKIEEVKPTTGATAGQIPIVREVSGAMVFQMENVPSSGHKILNQNGTEMTQRDKMQFSYADVTDDSTNGKTLIDGRGHKVKNASGTVMTRRESLQASDGLEFTDNEQGGSTKVGLKTDYISLADWNAMTEQEQEAYKASHYRFGIELPDTEGVINAEYMKLLWENPNTTQAFASQTITLNSADYDFLLWIHSQGSLIIKKGQTPALLEYSSFSGSNNTVFIRRADRTNDTSFNVGDCSYTGGSTANSFCVPIAIYGIKASFQFKMNAIAYELSTSAENCIMPDGVTSVADMVEDSGWQTLSDYVKYRKIGKVVHIKLISGYTIASSSWTTLATLPSGLAPNPRIITTIYYLSASSYAALQITTAGAIQVRGEASMDSQYSFVLD